MSTNQHVDLKKAITIVFKRSWIIISLLLVFAFGARYVSMNYIDKIYQAQTTMFIGKEQGSLSNIGISLSDLQTYNQLIVDYKEIANSRLVIMATMNSLNTHMDIDSFRKALSIDVLDNSRLFTVSFSSKDPVLAANIANEMAKQLSIAVSEIVSVENIRVIDSALVPTEPVSPNVNIITLLAGALGIILGLFVIYLIEMFNDTFPSKDSIEAELKLDVVAIIPKAKTNRKDQDNEALVTISNPHSYLSESYRLCRTNINYMNMNNNHQVLMFTSSVASEGKTTTSCNLAITMAQGNKKVLLIDGDLKRSLVYKMFDINMRPGLTDALYENRSLISVVQHIKDVPGLDVLTAGRATDISTELLGSDSFKKILNDARGVYDTIIIDAPPVLYVSDTVIISKLVDEVLFIVEMGKTNKAAIIDAKKALEKVGVNIMGLILTKIKVNKKDYYYYSDDIKK